MSSKLAVISDFFSRDICRRAVAPIKDGAVFHLEVDGTAYTVKKVSGNLEASEGAPSKPDMTFNIPPAALDILSATKTEDIGEMGVEVLKLLTSSEPDLKIQSRVHIGPFDLFLKGYLGVLPLGGPTVMKYLASKGLTNPSKIKDAISRMRSK